MTDGATFDRPYGHALAELGQRYADLVVVEADLQRATETDLFQAQFPERYFQVGIAEANMVSVSAGLALSGKIPFCATFACFMTQRVCDQVAISVAYCHANVKMVGVDAGLSTGGNGASHQGMLDLAIMRAMPNLTVYVPCDATETFAIMDYLVEHPGPAYMRAHRRTNPVILDRSTYRFVPGKAVQLQEGHDVTIIACGIMVPRAIEASRALAREGVSVRLVNMSSIKPIDEETIVRAARDTGAIVTAENHTVLGGLGSAVAEVVTSHRPVPVKRVGIQDTFGEVGPTEWLAERYKISASDIVQAAREALASKVV